MTIPFLEVVYHTSNEMSKQSDVIKVTPQNLSLEEVLTSNNTKAVLWMTIKRLVLPVSSLLFTLIFWIVGLIASYYSGGNEDSNMSDCVVIELNWWKNNFLSNVNLRQYLFVKWCSLVQYNVLDFKVGKDSFNALQKNAYLSAK